MVDDTTHQTADHPLLATFAVLLQELANWRREAIGDPNEYAERDKLLLQLQRTAEDVAYRTTGSYI